MIHSFEYWRYHSVTCVKAFKEPHQRLSQQDASDFCEYGQSRIFNHDYEVWPRILNFGELNAINWAQEGIMKSVLNSSANLK